MFAILKQEKDPGKIRARLDALAKERLDHMSDAERAATGDPKKEADAQIASVTSPWFLYFLTYDPRVALRKVTVPVLVLNGELDLQVPAAQNIPEIQKALAEAHNDDVTVKRFPQMNHLFQVCKTGSPDEYAAIDETINPQVLECIRDWILEHVDIERK
jgi:fermentation-respiration switch protein FrsA (DUF1100 family)